MHQHSGCYNHHSLCGVPVASDTCSCAALLPTTVCKVHLQPHQVWTAARLSLSILMPAAGMCLVALPHPERDGHARGVVGRQLPTGSPHLRPGSAARARLVLPAQSLQPEPCRCWQLWDCHLVSPSAPCCSHAAWLAYPSLSVKLAGNRQSHAATAASSGHKLTHQSMHVVSHGIGLSPQAHSAELPCVQTSVAVQLMLPYARRLARPYTFIQTCIDTPYSSEFLKAWLRFLSCITCLLQWLRADGLCCVVLRSGWVRACPGAQEGGGSPLAFSLWPSRGSSLEQLLRQSRVR